MFSISFHRPIPCPDHHSAGVVSFTFPQICWFLLPTLMIIFNLFLHKCTSPIGYPLTWWWFFWHGWHISPYIFKYSHMIRLCCFLNSKHWCGVKWYSFPISGLFWIISLMRLTKGVLQIRGLGSFWCLHICQRDTVLGLYWCDFSPNFTAFVLDALLYCAILLTRACLAVGPFGAYCALGFLAP